MFERYTEKARRVIFFSHYEASRLGSATIASEHMLLGLLREDEPILALFMNFPASVQQIRQKVEERSGGFPRLPAGVDLPLSEECKRALACAAEEAEGLRHSWIGTEHLLLGLLRIETGAAARILQEHGVDIVTARMTLASKKRDGFEGVPLNTYRYRHLDVFTDHLFCGNQLAVFLQPEGLTAEAMQRIALEMAFSETTFVFPPETKDLDAQVRIFTPRAEIPMAGHPTIGTTFALAHEGWIAKDRSEIVLGLGIGPTRVRLEWDEGRLRFAWMVQPVPVFGAKPADVAGLAAAIGVSETDIRDTGLPVQEVSSGMPYLFVPLLSRKAVDAAVVDQQALTRFYRGANLPELGTFIFSTEKSDDHEAVYSRMFAPAFGVPEDPATGGASGPLGAYLVHYGVVLQEQMISLQGVKMGRPSRIHISIKRQDGVISEVLVGGSAVVVGGGTIRTE